MTTRLIKTIYIIKIEWVWNGWHIFIVQTELFAQESFIFDVSYVGTIGIHIHIHMGINDLHCHNNDMFKGGWVEKQFRNKRIVINILENVRMVWMEDVCVYVWFDICIVLRSKWRFFFLFFLVCLLSSSHTYKNQFDLGCKFSRLFFFLIYISWLEILQQLSFK